MRARYICHATPCGFIKRRYLVVLIFLKQKRIFYKAVSKEDSGVLSHKDEILYNIKNLDTLQMSIKKKRIKLINNI